MLKPNAEADRKRKERSRPSANEIFATEKTIKETEGKASTQNVMLPKLPIDDSKDNNWTKWKRKLEALNESSGLLFKLYEQYFLAQQAQAGAEGAQATGNAGDDVVEQSLRK